ncbi:NADH-quinone oxidoreductase subunit NuoK [Pontibacter sp. G13]|uniref:NADH-quinone oxidoreductase subunit NuoK n=1 Tax=Pontibacter sp. G13 TaxID=3074898 RepID=UPI00288BE21F|nr:NADH-quinone oxidoreductase subunit NuoK [Pontibacter sp. G13]WNJ16755.1 NADH-quinone oxidoreductase subunit NuoK [Pontibacter sp. G13]
MEFLTPNTYSYLTVALIMFTLGAIGVMTRRNGIVVFMCIELMLNAVNLSLVTFSRMHNDANGSMLVFFVMCVAAAEAVVGLAVIIALFRNKLDIDINNVNIFKW